MTTYPAISLWQPWASLLFVPGAKVHETRHWLAPKRLIGKRMLIHAAKTDRGFRSMDEDSQLASICTHSFPTDFRLPRGALLGTAILTRSFQIGTSWIGTNCPDTDEDEICGNWEPGRYAWRLEDRRAFAEPIPAKGQQGFWTAEIANSEDRP